MREPYVVKLKSGQELALAFTFKAIKWFEKQTGQFFFGDSGAGRIGADYLSAGIAAGLLHKNPRIKVDEIDDLIEKHMEAGGDLPTLVNELVEALKAWGILKGDEEDKDTARADPLHPTKGAAPSEK